MIELAPCAPTADGRLAACAPASLTSAVLVKPKAAKAPALAAALSASLGSLVGLAVPGTAPTTCGAAVQVVLPLGTKKRAKQAIVTRAYAGTRRDVDRLTLVCERAL
ncbi:MAG: hypothetical protein KIT14_25005 [bacterium]|nr:hypothetical protein [bacterium]